MNFMAMTTPLVDMVDLFRRVGVPVILIDVMTLMYRFIFVLLDSLDRMYVAQNSRLGYRSWRRGSTARGVSQPFVHRRLSAERECRWRWTRGLTMVNSECCQRRISGMICCCYLLSWQSPACSSPGVSLRMSRFCASRT